MPSTAPLARVLDRTCRVRCADCDGGEYAMAATSGLENVSQDACVFTRADGDPEQAAGGAVPSLERCSKANALAFDGAVMEDLGVRDVGGREVCVASFRQGLGRAAYAAYEAALRTNDVKASRPYLDRKAMWEANDLAIHGTPDGYLYRIADLTRMVYGPLEPRAGDAVTRGAEYDLERRLTATTASADAHQARWDACEAVYFEEYTAPGACKEQRALCHAQLQSATERNAELKAALDSAQREVKAIEDDLARNYVLVTDCEAMKRAAFDAGFEAERVASFAGWITRAECDARINDVRTRWP